MNHSSTLQTGVCDLRHAIRLAAQANDVEQYLRQALPELCHAAHAVGGMAWSCLPDRLECFASHQIQLSQLRPTDAVVAELAESIDAVLVSGVPEIMIASEEANRETLKAAELIRHKRQLIFSCWLPPAWTGAIVLFQSTELPPDLKWSRSDLLKLRDLLERGWRERTPNVPNTTSREDEAAS